jgi:hypothetical protein
MADTKQRRPAKPQAVDAHPRDQFQSDLKSDPMAGQNIGAAGSHPEKHARTAHDVKDVHARFRDWLDSDLKQIPVLPAGSRLEQNATYIDLAADRYDEFTATGDMVAGPEHRYVPKAEVPYELWNRLLGIENVHRTGVREP